MAGLNYYKPKFNWDALDKPSEFSRFKSNCKVLFNGPLDESPPNRQAGLVVNWLGSEAGLTLQSLNLTYDEPDTIFNAIRNVFRPIGNRTMSRFIFKSLKQKQGATVDAYMAELKVLIKECGYDQNMQQILSKDQFIFGITVCEIQEHLLNDIEDDHNLNHCLQEACKIESCIAQRKLLGLKSVQYDAFVERGRPKKKTSNLKIGLIPNVGLSLELGTASIVVQITNIGIVLHLGKHVRVVVRKITLPKSAGLIKAKAKARALAVLRSHLNTGSSM